jgi:hypothetical protein
MTTFKIKIMTELDSATLGLGPFSVELTDIDDYMAAKKFLKNSLSMETFDGITLKIKKVRNSSDSIVIWMTIPDLAYWLHENRGYECSRFEFCWDEIELLHHAVIKICRLKS